MCCHYYYYSEDMGAYSLHMTEDDGEIDEDFPALDNKVTMSQYAISANR